MPKHQKSGKKQIEQYDYKETMRTNDPPIGLVTPETDEDAKKIVDDSEIESLKIVEVE